MGRKFWLGSWIGLSAILLLLSLAGILLVLGFQRPLTQKVTDRLAQVDAELARAQTALTTTRAELERTLRVVAAAEETLSALQDELALAKSLFDMVDTALDERLVPGLESSRDRLEGAASYLEDLSETLAIVNALPFVNIPLPGEELLAGLAASARALDAEIARLQDLARRVSTFTGDAAYLMGGDLSETRANLENFLAVVEEYDEKVAAMRADLAAVSERLPAWSAAAGALLVLFLLWFGLSQFGMLLHGLSLWQGGDPLEVLRSSLSALRRKGDSPAADEE
jgi:predicted  nucleic acid-binding Zn-ribbon protein